MSLGIRQPPIELDGLDDQILPGQLGVFELCDADRRVRYIGYAGGREPFGLRSAIGRAVPHLSPPARFVRWELTHGYLSRWKELLMLHVAEHGVLPPDNPPNDDPEGRLSLR